MARRTRLHIPGGYYYVNQCCRSGETLFACADDYEKFGRYLGKVLKPLNVRVHAYCWLPTEFHLLVEVNDKPVSKLIQRLANHLTYRVYGSRSAPTLFPERHHQMLIDQDEFLLKGVRFIHWRSVSDALQVQQLNGYEWSSHLGYLGLIQVPWLTTYVALGQLNRHTERARRAYADFSMVAPPESELNLFQEQVGGDPRVLGNSFFVRRLGLGLPIPARITLEELTKLIAQRMGVDPAQVRSRSQCGQLPLARAAIAWHGVARKITTMTRAARFFGLDRTTLPKVIAKNRKLHPEWFDLWTLPGVGPIVATPLVMTMEDVSRAADDDGVEPGVEPNSESDWTTRDPRLGLHGLARVH